MHNDPAYQVKLSQTRYGRLVNDYSMVQDLVARVAAHPNGRNPGVRVQADNHRT